MCVCAIGVQEFMRCRVSLHMCGRIHVDAAVIMWFCKITDELAERPRLLCFICSGDRFFVCGVAERVHVNLLLCVS